MSKTKKQNRELRQKLIASVMNELGLTDTAPNAGRMRNFIQRYAFLGDKDRLVNFITETPEWKTHINCGHMSAKDRKRQFKIMRESDNSAQRHAMTTMLSTWYPGYAERKASIPMDVMQQLFPEEARHIKAELETAERQRIQALEDKALEAAASIRGMSLAEYKALRAKHGLGTIDLKKQELREQLRARIAEGRPEPIKPVEPVSRLSMMTEEELDAWRKREAASRELANAWRGEANNRQAQKEQEERQREAQALRDRMQARAHGWSTSLLVQMQVPDSQMDAFIKLATDLLVRDEFLGPAIAVERFKEKFPSPEPIETEQGPIEPPAPVAEPVLRQGDDIEGDRIERTVSQRDAGKQAQFKRSLIRNFDGRCAISGKSLNGVLEAAHIEHGDNFNPSNGILMEPTFHKLYDRHLMGIHPDTLAVHFAEGIEFPEYEGKVIKPRWWALDVERLHVRWCEFLNRK